MNANNHVPQITVTMQFPVSDIASTIISAVMGGIYYWARDVECEIPEALRNTDLIKKHYHGSDIAYALMTPGCTVTLIERNGEGGEDPVQHTVTHENLTKALAAMPEHIGTVLAGGDAESGDILFQIMVFDQIKYG